MGEGWETRRRREAGNEWLTVRFAAPAVVRLAEIDTSGYLGNSPGTALLRGSDAAVDSGDVAGETDGDRPGSSWFCLLPKTPLLPDTPHRFRIAEPRPAGSVRLDVFPDGGVARLRLYGSLTPEGLAEVRRRWDETRP
jgi:allantoicase